MIKRKPETRVIDDNTAIISTKDLFDPKLNPTMRLDAGFAIKLAKKLEKERKRK